METPAHNKPHDKPIHETIYPPKEDSEFLAGFVSQYAFGKTLDMGCGSGIQAKTASKISTVTEVIAVDKNKNAVNSLKEEIQNPKETTLKKISIIESNLFSALNKEKFDTIICNPPYLPNDSKINDIALHGGPQGYEWSVMFLKQAKTYIAPNGQILFLFSSLTNKERIDRVLKELHYHNEILGELYVGMFEHLYVYRIWRSHD